MDAVQLLQRRGAMILPRITLQMPTLHWPVELAIHYDHVHVARFLIEEKGLPFRKASIRKMQSLEMAELLLAHLAPGSLAGSGYLNTVCCLCAQNLSRMKKLQPVLSADMIGQGMKPVEMLLDKGFAIDDRDSDGLTSIMTLCMNREPSPEAIEFMLRRGANIHVRDDKGNTACESTGIAALGVKWIHIHKGSILINQIKCTEPPNSLVLKP